jgi:hypothetical protein
MLMTFTLGLAVVFVFNGTLKSSDEIKVNLPKVQCDSPTIIFSLPNSQSDSSMMLSIEKRSDPTEFRAGASGGTTCDEAKARLKNKKTKIPNCD